MEVNGFQNRRRYLCNAALRETKDAEERGRLGSGECLLPVGRKEPGHRDKYSHVGGSLCLILLYPSTELPWMNIQ